MTPRTAPSAPSAPARKNKSLTAAGLPIRVPVIHGVRTASYLARTASANAVELPLLLGALHNGSPPAPPRSTPPPTKLPSPRSRWAVWLP
ncbi:hypothetical protein [Streptomyces sp. NPDC002602]|uniref:hypothetical protein n=1 Tax=Streptomyces sp. NPDC002602 TaxID=3364654 RepID=UPI0036CBA0EE